MAPTYLAPPYAPARPVGGLPPRCGENTPPLPLVDDWLWRTENHAFSRAVRAQKDHILARFNGVHTARWATMAAALTILAVAAGVVAGAHWAARA